jgi:hypothetical protein
MYFNNKSIILNWNNFKYIFFEYKLCQQFLKSKKCQFINDRVMFFYYIIMKLIYINVDSKL